MKLFLLRFPAIQFKGIDPCSHEGTWGQDYGWTPASSARVPATRPSLCGPGGRAFSSLRHFLFQFWKAGLSKKSRARAPGPLPSEAACPMWLWSADNSFVY